MKPPDMSSCTALIENIKVERTSDNESLTFAVDVKHEVIEDTVRLKSVKQKYEAVTYFSSRKFSKNWLSIPGISNWVHPLRCDPTFAWCKFCRRKIRAHLSDLKNHSKTVKHRKNMKDLSPEIPSEPSMDVDIVIHEDATGSGAVSTVDERGSTSDTKEILNPANIGFVGCGNMAQALLNAFIKKGLVEPTHIMASAPTDRNLSKLRSLGVKTTHDNNDVVRMSDVVFFCMKPHMLVDAIGDLQPLENDHNPLFVSIITGYDIKTLEGMLLTLTDEPRVIRTVPNTPSMVGEGCCVFALGNYATPGDGAIMTSMLSAVGICAEIPEDQLDAACGLAGSGPAYIYAAIEALADGGVKMGLPRQLSQQLAAQTVRGAATMVLESGKHPGQLKDEVCSPNGTTIAAMHTLEKNGLRNALMSAVEASALRSRQLGGKD